MMSNFGSCPQGLPDAGGAWLRGEGPLPPHAVWLPLVETAHWRQRLRLAAMTVAAGALGMLPWIPDTIRPPAAGLALLVALLAWRLPTRKGRPNRSGNQGLLLTRNRLFYQVGSACAAIDRADVTGLERRVLGRTTIVGAFTLRAHTGRGALPSPQPGLLPVQQMEAWLAQERPAAVPHPEADAHPSTPATGERF